MGFLYTPTPFKASGLLMSKSGIVLPSCSFYPSAGRQIDTYSHLLDSDIAKSASLFKQTSLFFFASGARKVTHTPRGATRFDIYVKGNYILCNSNLLSHGCFFGVKGVFLSIKRKKEEKIQRDHPQSLKSC